MAIKTDIGILDETNIDDCQMLYYTFANFYRLGITIDTTPYQFARKFLKANFSHFTIYNSFAIWQAFNKTGDL